MIGKTIAHYRVGEKIGAGGMGVVYRATDTKLNRDVALKVLPEEFAKDHDRMARFRREAQVLASLNHPNIAAIYGLEEQDGVHAIVLELVEGPTLRERIKQSAIPLEEALNIAKQIAEALESAHEQGVIHRDLKPANLKVKEDGQVKVLDFGLAKALEGDLTEEEIGNSPTLSVAATRAGVILGTAAYMSPEQAAGKKADRRADIWSFGVVLFEMLTGQRLFTGESAVEVMSKVMRDDPGWDLLPSATPAAIRKLLRRCLTKDRKQRLHAIADARFEIEEALSGDEEPAGTGHLAAQAGTPSGWQSYVPKAVVVTVVTALLVAAGFWMARWSGPSNSSVTKLSISLPRGQEFTTSPVISPDGKVIAYTASASGRPARLYLRPLDSFEATEIAGSLGAHNPFFSPDSRWVGFFTWQGLWRVQVTGAAPVLVLAEPMHGIGGTWGKDDTIVFATIFHSLRSVPAAGGEVRQLTRPVRVEDGYSHVWPQFLPGDRKLLFTVWGMENQAGPTPTGKSGTAVLDTESGQWETVINSWGGQYISAGYLLTSHDDNGVRISRLDAANPGRVSPALPLLDNVFWVCCYTRNWVSVSDDGTLLYVPGDPGRKRIAWVDREGRIEHLEIGRRKLGNPRDIALSPDKSKLAYVENNNLWVADLERGTSTLVTQVGNHWAPVWSREGNKIFFSSNRGGTWAVYHTAPDGSREAELFYETANALLALSQAPDGSLLVAESDLQTQWDLKMISPEGEAAPFLVTPAMENQARFSPDGRFVAYQSNQSGILEIYIRPVSGSGGVVKVSAQGGQNPVWSQDGQALYYRAGDALLVVRVRSGRELSVNRPQAVVSAGQLPGGGSDLLFDVSHDGFGFLFDVSADEKRFLMILREPEAIPTELNIVQNWFQVLRDLSPAKQD